jgi:hypothetical protein
MAGVLPTALTLRQLSWMVFGRRRLEWGVASSILAKIHNLTSKQSKSPSDFDPTIAEDLRDG